MKFAAVTTLAIALIAVAALPAQARKPIRVLGCSAGDLSGDGASICVKRGELDVLSGSSSVHVAVCSGGAVYCCISKDGATSGGRCIRVSKTVPPVREDGGAKDGNNGSATQGGGNGCSGGVC